MSSKEMAKEILLNDKEKLIYILSELGCHKINPNFANNEIRCALPDGDNETSVSVKLSQSIPCRIYTRSEYEGLGIKDIFSLVQYIKKYTFIDSVDWVCNKLGVKNDGCHNISNTLDIVNDIRKIKRKQSNKDQNIIHEIMEKSEVNRFKQHCVKEWVEEGISEEIQKKYDIRIDERGSRWLIPIRNDEGQIISLKARTYIKNWHELGLTKFTHYKKIGNNDLLFGYYFNKESIISHDEIILFEGEKSVMKASTYGYDWCCSIGCKTINPFLFKKILKIRCSNIVIALDKDASRDEMYSEAKKLSKYFNVYIIIDTQNLLGDKNLKNAPIDCGKETWEKLYNSKIRVR